jgi:hypothetical protein
VVDTEVLYGMNKRLDREETSTGRDQDVVKLAFDVSDDGD